MNVNDIPTHFGPDEEFILKTKQCQECLHGSKDFCKVWNARLGVIIDRIESCDDFRER